MPGLRDSFTSALTPIPEQRESPPSPPGPRGRGRGRGRGRPHGAAQRCASLEGSDCESLDSSLGSEGDAEELEEVSLPDFDLLNDPEDELLCANLMNLIQVSLNKANINAKRCSRLLMPAQLVTQEVPLGAAFSPLVLYARRRWDVMLGMRAGTLTNNLCEMPYCASIDYSLH
ncbi:DNA damage-inducible transcript 4 protein [Alligator mississippiensis]|uniref:DNA damage-inducible transcript 4 protein n=1 Tax=Alligator mississippiensis TaxID=8496 RepID=A0A151NZU3_ALLMI|nr:DNA damage-inducible transcript 4 protein [Alligator mississippiensis]